ncbi:MAG: hypothetical protein H0X25_19235 [Acidobacteriales bacterium]|nr:hypothetical protein [Terriglobales bacterium]
MKQPCSGSFARLTLFALLTLVLGNTCLAQTRQILHAFYSTDGNDLQSQLVMDPAGNLYGTAPDGGAYGYGTVFMLSPSAGGTYKLTLLHSFGAFENDGQNPYGGLAFDSAGNLYGTTYLGGYPYGGYRLGTVYQLLPSGGKWIYKLLWSFNITSHDGLESKGTPIVDAAGNIYGRTLLGGTTNDGAIFELSPQANGSWQENRLFNFENTWDKYAYDLALAADGTFYGTTGSVNGTGSIFHLAPSGEGGWTETILAEFGPVGSFDPACPCGTTLDAAGNLFGTSQGGGTAGAGTLYELPHSGDGSWGPLVVIHSFGGPFDGQYPLGRPVFDASGNIYGTTVYGSRPSGGGILYRFSPTSEGGWMGSILHDFGGGNDGKSPEASPTVDSAGNIYGTTSLGGIYNGGTVWRITP